MTKSRLGLNILIFAGLLTVIIFAYSVFSSPARITVASSPKIKASTPVLGPAKAKVQIIEFGDFQCPLCGQLNATFKNILAAYGDKIRFAWKDFPLYSIHDQALNAAESARCAGKQGKFWEMHDKIFENQKNLANETYLVLARGLALDENKFINCVNNHESLSLIEADLKEAAALGVTGTPHFYVNNYLFTELPSEPELKAVIDAELAK
jgi:protein-disulfide isomerase